MDGQAYLDVQCSELSIVQTRVKERYIPMDRGRMIATRASCFGLNGSIVERPMEMVGWMALDV